MSAPQHESFSGYAAEASILPPSQHRASSGAWSTADDNKLLQARAQGLNWGQIKDAYFPSKSANACRKRHERLMERKGADDWDTRKFQHLAKEYMGMRKEIWSGLAARTGEKWNVVGKDADHVPVHVQRPQESAIRRSPGFAPRASRDWLSHDRV
jgi:hypothetical protein